jgi:hypothetical protein
MARFTREEIETAFLRYQDMGLAAARSGDWTHWGKMFTEDCSYKEHCLGEWGGREAIVREMASVMQVTETTETVDHLEGSAANFSDGAANPWIWCNQYPCNDYVIDVDRGWVWSLIWNRMEDPGNGRVFQCNCLTLLIYAGNGQFSYEEDLYNPRQFGKMMDEWLEVKAECDARQLDYEARAEAARAVAIEPELPVPDASLMRPSHKAIETIPTPQGRFREDEIEAALRAYQEGLARAGRANDWRHWGACLTPDTTLIDCELGHLGKRDAVVREVGARLHQADDKRPWAYLNHFPFGEYVIDTQRDTVWAFVWARFRDPGDGSRHEAKLFLRMVYGGDGLFKEIETLYDPNALRRAMSSWKKSRAQYEEHRADRELTLAENERRALEIAPLKLDEDGKEVR